MPLIVARNTRLQQLISLGLTIGGGTTLLFIVLVAYDWQKKRRLHLTLYEFCVLVLSVYKELWQKSAITLAEGIPSPLKTG